MTNYYWSASAMWRDNIDLVSGLYGKAEQAVRAALGLPVDQDDDNIIDEMAILMPGREMAMEMISDGVENGWEYFNAAKDDVTTSPLDTSYRVQYHFLRSAAYPFRLEVMHVLQGFSPLHQALSLKAPEGMGFPIVHASFKVANPVGLMSSEKALLNAGYQLAQSCLSTYGMFGYWRRKVSEPWLGVYLKPRLNIRDIPKEDAVGHAHIPALPQQVLAEAGMAPERKQTWQTEGDFAS